GPGSAIACSGRGGRRATRSRNPDGLVAVLEPEVVLRADTGVLKVMRGARSEQGSTYVLEGCSVRPTDACERSPRHHCVASGWTADGGEGFTVTGGKIVEIDILAGPRSAASARSDSARGLTLSASVRLVPSCRFAAVDENQTTREGDR